MPVTNRGGLPGADYNYLKAQPPSWESVRTGLSIFALVIIARYCVQTIYRWLRPTARRNTATLLPTNNLPLQRQYKPHIGPMDDEKHIEGVNDQHEDLRAPTTATTTTTTTNTTAALDRHPHWRSAGGTLPGPFISRLPPAPPLTPPELSTAVFTLDNEPSPSSQSFIHQPNPDYMSSTSTTAFQTGSPDSASIPRRRSYTRTFPISVHGSHSPQAQSPEAESVDPTFSPSSYPPSAGLLPPAPPSGLGSEPDDHGHRNVDVQGEILSVLDRDGAGWTRHTRVYGGGACLACAASGGGFYGATVTPEEMR
ncbi:hypothetical protein GGI42DRAFT_106721 [Trichoderma sp. SZMC 28013]